MKSVDALAGAEELIATAQALELDGPRITALRNRVEGSALRRRRVYRAIDAELGLPVAALIIPARDAFEHAAIQHAPLVAPRSRPRRLASLPPPHRRARGRGMTRGELKVTRIDSLPVTSRRDASREHLCRYPRTGTVRPGAPGRATPPPIAAPDPEPSTPRRSISRLL